VRNPLVIVLLLLLLAATIASHDRRPVAAIEDTTLRHRADYAACAAPPSQPLLRSPRGKYDMRLGQPFNDKGIS
jgi:hypothetical protein